MPRTSNWSLPSSFASSILYTFLIIPIYATCHTHPTLLDMIILIIFGEQYKLWGSSLLLPDVLCLMQDEIIFCNICHN
jgi:hypothetical protein